jgi:hypothetical protein
MAMQISPLYQDSWKVMICETLEVIEVVVLVDKAGPLLVVVEGVEEAQKKCVEVEVEPMGQEAPQYLEVDPGLGPPGPGRPPPCGGPPPALKVASCTSATSGNQKVNLLKDSDTYRVI